jgi:hypothetical protein
MIEALRENIYDNARHLAKSKAPLAAMRNSMKVDKPPDDPVYAPDPLRHAKKTT